jgi:hypothetical protein
VLRVIFRDWDQVEGASGRLVEGGPARLATPCRNFNGPKAELHSTGVNHTRSNTMELASPPALFQLWMLDCGAVSKDGKVFGAGSSSACGEEPSPGGVTNFQGPNLVGGLALGDRDGDVSVLRCCLCGECVQGT